MKMINNYKILYSLNILRNILVTFLDTFLVLYFFNISNSNILPIGIYKLISVIAIWLTIFLLKNICKGKNRINLLRIGILLNFAYFLALIIFKEKVVDYIYLIGLLYGLQEGFYYSVFNMIQSDGITNNERQKYVGSTHAVKNFLAILLPTIFGFVILKSGFVNTLVVFLILVAVQIILSFLFKDLNLPKHKKVDFKKFRKICNSDNRLKLMFKVCFFNGLVYSEGALTLIISLFIIRVFSDSFSLGIFTSIFSIISAVLGILFAKKIKPKNYNKWIIISTLLTILTLIWMIIDCNAISIIIFNFFQKISKEITNLVNDKNIPNISNDEKIKKEYKVEFFLHMETALVLGRIIGSILFILMAFTNNNIILYIFIIFLIMWAYYSVRMQNEMSKKR